MSEHVDIVRLERFCVDDLSPAENAFVQVHVNACERCKDLVNETRAFVSADLLQHPPKAFVAKIIKPKRAFWFWLAPLGAVAAAAVFAFAPKGPDVTLKGAHMSVHRYRADASSVISSGDKVRVGDRVEVRVVDRQNEVRFVPDNGAEVALPLHKTAGVESAWFVMEAPCTAGFIVVKNVSRLRIECE